MKLTAPQIVCLRKTIARPGLFHAHPGTVRALISRGLLTERLLPTEAGVAAARKGDAR